MPALEAWRQVLTPTAAAAATDPSSPPPFPSPSPPMQVHGSVAIVGVKGHGKSVQAHGTRAAHRRVSSRMVPHQLAQSLSLFLSLPLIISIITRSAHEPNDAQSAANFLHFGACTCEPFGSIRLAARGPVRGRRMQERRRSWRRGRGFWLRW
jgi:hypothetical protein